LLSLVRLLTEVVIAGLGGVLISIPQIALLFAFLAVLEGIGCMARVTFLMNKLMRPFRLSAAPANNHFVLSNVAWV
jgi:ferrous iron transport protein B